MDPAAVGRGGPNRDPARQTRPRSAAGRDRLDAALRGFPGVHSSRLARPRSERLVEIIKNRGAFVRRITRQETIHTLDVLDALSVLTIQQVTAKINEEGVKSAVMSALNAAKRFQAKLNTTLPISSYVEETNRLWNTLTKSAGNAILDETHARLQGLLHRIRLAGFVFRGRENRWVIWHFDMLEAMLEGNARRAIKLMQASARESRSAIMSLPDEAFG